MNRSQNRECVTGALRFEFLKIKSLEIFGLSPIDVTTWQPYAYCLLDYQSNPLVKNVFVLVYELAAHMNCVSQV